MMTRRLASLRLLGMLAGLAACLPVAATTVADDTPPGGVPDARTVQDDAPVAHIPDPSVPAPVTTSTPVPSAATESASDAAPADRADSSCPAPDEIVRRLQARYDETQAFRADFEQETYVLAMGERDHARGTVAFSKPGRMRWDFVSPTSQMIVSDGKTLWIYQPEEQQVLRAAFQAAFVSTTPVSFLAGVGRIIDDFNPRPAERACTETRAYVQLEAKDSRSLGGLELTVDRATFDILEAAVTDPLENVTTLRFTDMQRNVEIPPEEFLFEVPAGVDVILAPGSAPPL